MPKSARTRHSRAAVQDVLRDSRDAAASVASSKHAVSAATESQAASSKKSRRVLRRQAWRQQLGAAAAGRVPETGKDGGGVDDQQGRSGSRLVRTDDVFSFDDLTATVAGVDDTNVERRVVSNKQRQRVLVKESQQHARVLQHREYQRNPMAVLHAHLSASLAADIARDEAEAAERDAKREAETRRAEASRRNGGKKRKKGRSGAGGNRVRASKQQAMAIDFTNFDDDAGASGDDDDDGMVGMLGH